MSRGKGKRWKGGTERERAGERERGERDSEKSILQHKIRITQPHKHFKKGTTLCCGKSDIFREGHMFLSDIYIYTQLRILVLQ